MVAADTTTASTNNLQRQERLIAFRQLSGTGLPGRLTVPQTSVCWCGVERSKVRLIARDCSSDVSGVFGTPLPHGTVIRPSLAGSHGERGTAPARIRCSIRRGLWRHRLDGGVAVGCPCL